MGNRVVSQAIPKVDYKALVTGKAVYTDDLAAKDSLVVKVLRSPYAHALIEDINLTRAELVPDIECILTYKDCPDKRFTMAGQTYPEPSPYDRLILDQRVRFVGDAVAIVAGRTKEAVNKALKLIKVKYEVLEPVLDFHKAKDNPILVHPEENWKSLCPVGADNKRNLCAHDSCEEGDIEAVLANCEYIIDQVYHTKANQQAMMETFRTFTYMDVYGRLNVVSSTQIPHIVRRVIGQALGIGWGSIRVIKPYIGGGFGNKQEVLYEPLNAWLTTQVGGRCVRLDVSREETFQNTRSRHPIAFDVEAAVDGDGYLMARSCRAVSNQGGYASHGNAIVANAITGFRQLYLDRIGHHSTAYTVYTNRPAPGAMRGYGIPQCNFAVECMMDDIARERGWDPKAFRLANLMPLGYVDPFNGITCHSTGLAECIEKGADFIGWVELREKYKEQSGPVRRGVGMACFSYKTGVYPISLETASARLVLNQDGTVQLHLGATEIGQGGDTVFSQMAAQAIGIPTEDVHIVSFQDTDTAPFDTGAYASRQTYVTGKAIKKVGEEFREKLLAYAAELFPDASGLDIRERQVVDGAGEALISLADLAMNAFYSLEHSVHISAEATSHCKENTFAFGCCFAEVEVDIPVGKGRGLRIVNVHHSGKLINPKLAEAQVHGGMSMGLGYGLSEELLFDAKGRPLNDNLLDYNKMPTSMDHPELTALFVETDDPSGPFGNKALGEPPTIPVAPAIRNAVLQATGVAVNTLPLSPQKLVEEFTRGGLI